MEVISPQNEMANNASGTIATYNGGEVCPESVSAISVWAELDKQQGKEIKPDLFSLRVFLGPWTK